MTEDRTPNRYDRHISHAPKRSLAPGIVASAPGGAPRRRVGTILGLLTAVVATLAPPVGTDVHARPISATSGEDFEPVSGGQMPKITLAADRDTIIAGLEPVLLTATREAPFDDALTVTVQLTQEHSWLSDTSYDVTFAADDADTVLILAVASFSTSVVESGDLTAAVDSVDGYDTDEATATVFVISQDGPAVTVSLTQSSYLFGENADSTDVLVTARMAAGMPRGASIVVSVTSEGESESRPELTAVSGVDYWSFTVMPSLREQNFAREDGRWVASHRVPVGLLDDDVREGRERFRVHLQHSRRLVSDEVQLLNPDTTPCSGDDECRYLVYIDDDEDIPVLDLSVSADEINEEDEASSTATVSITNSKTFAADQTVTFAFAGTATEGTDYTVAPADGDDQASDHQIIMLADSTSVAVTLTAVDDALEDGNETIEVSATHDGDAIGNTQTVRILNQEVLPKITLAASRDTIIAGLETLVLTATREAPLDAPVAVTLLLTQEQNWLSRTSHQLNFAAQGSTANLNLSRALFSSAVTESGTLTATLNSVSGYDTEDGTATVHVVSQAGPAIKVSFAEESYRFAEDESDPSVTVVARAAAGMPRGARFTFSVNARSGTAASPGDYQAVSEVINVQEADFTLEGGVWEARHELPLTLVDDDAFEGTESFELRLQMLPGHPSEVQLSDLQGEACRDGCATPVEITDDEDIPTLALSVSDDEIMEEGETSSITTVSITNGKTFAADQMVTFELDGNAIPDRDYRVTPADADGGGGHQVILPAGSTSVEATFTAVNDELEEPTEKILLSVTHDGNEIGSGTIRLIDRFPGPRVEITFEGVQPPGNDYDDGTATGPFTTRITFSERVEGFTEDDIDWQTHYLTTVDTTVIGVLLWDYEEVRPGLEYTARMMPTQNGRLHILVHPHSASSVGTGDGNQAGHGSLQIELPPNRLMVEPRALTVEEGDDEGAVFVVVPTSAPTGTVTVTVSGMDGTKVDVDWSTWTFELPYWSGGWGVKVTAGDDANTRDETVTLRVAAAGGGYGGRSANVVVTVRDDDGGSGGDTDEGDVDDEAAALIVLEGMTPETAAAALFGEHDLSAAQLGALDRLGNRNGHYDLGDLLSWTERCRRSSGSGSRGRDGRRRGRTAQRMRRRARGLLRRSPGRPRRRCAPWFAPLLVAAATWSCTDDVVQPPAAPDPGVLTIELTAPPTARDIGALLLVEGPGIDSVRAPGFELFQSEAPGPLRIVVAGVLTTGPIAEFQMPDRALRTQYRVRLLEVTGEDYSLRDLSGYEVMIRR